MHHKIMFSGLVYEHKKLAKQCCIIKTMDNHPGPFKHVCACVCVGVCEPVLASVSSGPCSVLLNLSLQ